MVERLTVNQNVVGSNPTIFSFASCICPCSLMVEHNSHKIKGAGVRIQPLAPLRTPNEDPRFYLSNKDFGFIMNFSPKEIMAIVAGGCHSFLYILKCIETKEFPRGFFYI